MRKTESNFSLVYVSPRFPSVSLVFEQNELLGLLENNVELSLLVCRSQQFDGQGKLHEFARPLLSYAKYFSLAQFLRGLFLLVRSSPLKLIHTTLTILTECVRKPRRAHFMLASHILAISFYAGLHNKGAQWVHADFGQGSATCAYILAQFCSLPFSFTCHAFDIFSDAPEARESGTFFYKKAKAASAILAISSLGAARIREICKQDPLIQPIVHRVSVRSKSFDILPETAERKPYIAALGRLDPQKGFDVLIKAIGNLKRSGCVIACRIFGEGEERVALEKLIEDENLQGQVFLMGEYENHELPGLLEPATVLVVPSVVARNNQMDGVPTVIYEAMALGRVVIASNLSGIPEVIEDGVNGFLVSPGDIGQLADAIRYLHENPQIRSKIIKNARTYCEQNHDNVLQARKLINYFRR